MRYFRLGGKRVGGRRAPLEGNSSKAACAAQRSWNWNLEHSGDFRNLHHPRVTFSALSIDVAFVVAKRHGDVVETWPYGAADALRA
jgi:hypothetical protein